MKKQCKLTEKQLKVENLVKSMKNYGIINFIIIFTHTQLTSFLIQIKK
jgi:hypothetical protein